MSKEINQMFSDIHEKYDFMNHMLSLGVDRIWRRRTAKETVMDADSYKILDVATGTGDLAIAISNQCGRAGKNVKVVGVDFNKDMLRIAKRKVRDSKGIKFAVGDALALQFKSDCFEVVSSGFALRDFDDLGKFVREAHRVMKDGGKLVLVDMSKPEKGLMKYLFNVYFNVMLLEGMLVDKKAYSFLVNSIKGFDKNNLIKLLKREKFKDIKITNLTSDAAFLVTARK